MIPLTILYIFAGLLLLTKSQEIFLPNLRAGKYRIIFETLSSCGSTKNHSIQFNIHFSKRASNLTVILGNITMTTPFNDNQFIEVNLASWGSTGGWNDGVEYKKNNACSYVKSFLGYAWSSLAKAFNYPSENCPVHTGTYTSSGMDVNDFEKTNVPKQYFYGKYKFVLKIKTNDGKLLGCVTWQLKIVRPWEVPKN